MDFWSKVDSVYFKRLQDVQSTEFDYIIIGGGCYGTTFAHKVLELDPACRVLILEKGDLLIPEHIQNLPQAYQELMNVSEEQPWVSTSKYNIHGQVPFLGGRALFWNAWVPQPTSTQLRDWPDTVIQGLKSEWYEAGKYVGRRDFIEIGGFTGDLHLEVRSRLFAGLKNIPNSSDYSRASELEGAMATQEPHALHGWRRFSPVNVLVEDLCNYGDRLKVVVNCEAERLQNDGKRVFSIITKQGEMNVGHAQVILALGVIEAATVALRSFPENRLIGNNFCGHIRSQITVRLPRSSWLTFSGKLQVSDLYLDGTVGERQLHTHISTVYNPHPEAQMSDLYRVLPDPTTIDAYQDPDYVVILLQVLGELVGERSAQSTKRITLRNGETVVHLELNEDDLRFWDEMDRTLFQIADVLAAGTPLEYQHQGNTWSSIKPMRAEMRDNDLVHEAGVFWMGEEPESSVTDIYGRLHEIENVYVTGGGIYPTCGSWNATFAGIALTNRLARYLVHKSNLVLY